MDERPTYQSALGETFRCPGERGLIDRAAHLGRLAAFYPACRQCDSRHDVEGLSTLQIRQLGEVERRRLAPARFAAEGFESASANGLDRATMGQLSAALASVLWQDSNRQAAPRVLVACDGHWNSADPVAAACQALQWAGCQAIEAGAATTAAVATATAQDQIDAAMWIGHGGRGPHAMTVKFWGPAGRPWSLPGSLEPMRARQALSASRPRRRGGGSQRAELADGYLAPLSASFHGLRPLCFVLDTTCQPLVRYFQRLAAASDCRACRLNENSATAAGDSAAPADNNADDWPTQRTGAIGRQVVDSAAHFGLWVDGEGESIRLVDERGRAVTADKLLLALARYIARQSPGATILLEREADSRLQATLARANVRTLRAPAAREPMSVAIEATGALFAGGPSGRFWYAGQPAAADALVTLCLLLVMLSQSDRAMSEVLDAG